MGQAWTGEGVTKEDVEEAQSRIIQESTVVGHVIRAGVEGIVEGLGIFNKHIGSYLNEWRKPVADYGSNPPEWEVSLKASKYVGDIEFSRKDWALARAVVDEVLDLLLTEIQGITADYGGLKIERYVRQGSSREGLKVIAPEEFDTILQFHFEDFSWQPSELIKNGQRINEFCYLEVNQSMETLQRRLPKLHKKGAFSEHNGRVVVNARVMHTAVFGSIIDQARENVMNKFNESSRPGYVVKGLTRKINPPSINVTLHLKDVVMGHFKEHGSGEIDLDIVPGLVIGNEQVPDPSRSGQTMDCPVYAVFKWSEESSMKAGDFPKPDIVWRRSSSGVEKHTLDLARLDSKQLYIITAMRILKTYFVKTKQLSRPPPQIATVFKSYHLKQFAFYVILYTCYIYPDAKIDGVRDALIFFFSFMRISLKKKSLPHFFHSNVNVEEMYPTYPTEPNQLRFNLLRNKSPEALNQALLSLNYNLVPNLGFADGDDDDYTSYSSINSSLGVIKQKYAQSVSEGMFF